MKRLGVLLYSLAAVCIVSTSALAQVSQGTGSPPSHSQGKDPSEYSVSDFARLPFIDEIALSPGGERVAGLMAVGGVQHIGIFGLFAKEAKPFFARLPDGTEASWVRWVGEDNIIVGLNSLMPYGGRSIYVSRMIAVNRISGKITPIFPNSTGQFAADVLWIPSDGSTEILVSAQMSLNKEGEFWPTVYRVDVTNGKKKFAESWREGVMDWYADAKGQVRTGIGYRDHNSSFRLYYRADGETSMRQIAEAETKKDQSIFVPFHYLGGDRALAFHDDEDGRTAVFEIDVPAQADVATRFAAPKGYEVTAAIMSGDMNRVLGYRSSQGRGRVHWLDKDLAKLQVEIETSAIGRDVRINSMNRDHTRMLVTIDRPDSPGVLYFIDTVAKKRVMISTMNEALGAQPLSPVKAVRYKARDGLEIEAILTLPKNKPAKALPIVVMPHGGPWGQDTLDYDYWAQFVASRGYAVIQPNFRGSTGYGTPFTKAGEGQMGLAMQDDVTDALKWAVGEGIADPKRACIMGASYGGYAAMWGVAKDPDLYRCAISIAGVANLRREVNDFRSYRMGKKFEADWEKMTPDFAAVSPVNAVTKIKAPMLLIHGEKDVTVSVSQSELMFKKMRAAGKDVEYLPLPQADHYFTRQSDREALLGAVGKFLNRHNPAN